MLAHRGRQRGSGPKHYLIDSAVRNKYAGKPLKTASTATIMTPQPIPLAALAISSACALLSTQVLAQSTPPDREQFREVCVAQVQATNPESSPRSKGKQVENCMDGMVADARSAAAEAEIATARAETSTARAEIATARAIRAEMAKRPPDLAALRKLLETAQQQHAQRPNPEGQGMIDALRDYLRLAAQRKAQ